MDIGRERDIQRGRDREGEDNTDLGCCTRERGGGLDMFQARLSPCRAVRGVRRD